MPLYAVPVRHGTVPYSPSLNVIKYGINTVLNRTVYCDPVRGVFFFLTLRLEFKAYSRVYKWEMDPGKRTVQRE